MFNNQNLYKQSLFPYLSKDMRKNISILSLIFITKLIGKSRNYVDGLYIQNNVNNNTIQSEMLEYKSDDFKLDIENVNTHSIDALNDFNLINKRNQDIENMKYWLCSSVQAGFSSNDSAIIKYQPDNDSNTLIKMVIGIIDPISSSPRLRFYDDNQYLNYRKDQRLVEISNDLFKILKECYLKEYKKELESVNYQNLELISEGISKIQNDITINNIVEYLQKKRVLNNYSCSSYNFSKYINENPIFINSIYKYFYNLSNDTMESLTQFVARIFRVRQNTASFNHHNPQLSLRYNIYL